MAQGRRSAGIVKWFSGQKGFGFITPDDDGEDLFVHQTSIRSDGFRSLSEGEAVEFEVERGDDGRTKAVDVSGPNGAYISGGGGSGGGGGRGFSGWRGGRGGGGYAGGYGRGGKGGGVRGRTGGGACYSCGQIGHLARDCYQGSSGSGRYGGGGGGGGRVCYSCGEQGHFARECPHDQN